MKDKFDWPLLGRMLSYLTPYKSRFWGIGLCVLFSTGIGFLQPLVVRRITDEGMMSKDFAVVVTSAAALLLLVLLTQSAELVLTKQFAEIHNASYYALFHQAFNKLLHLKLSYFGDKNNAEILNTLEQDVTNVSMITERFVVLSATYVFKVVSGIVGLLVIDWRLTLVVVAMAPVKYAMGKALAKRKEKRINQMIELRRDFSGWFGDNVGGVREIKLWNLYGHRNTVFREKQEDVLKNNKDNTMLDGWNTFFELMLEWSVMVALYILGGLLVCTDALTIGGVFAFISYSGYVTGPISMVLNLRYFFSRIFPSARRLFAFLELDEEASGGQMLPDAQTIEIGFHDVSFQYEDSRKILRSVSFSLRQGEKVAIIGANGSGKSTILNLLLRFAEPDGGRVTLNGSDVSALDLNAYRGLFAVVSQESYLFHDTVLNNISLADSGHPSAATDACRHSGAHDFMERLPHKGDSMVGRNAAKLSGGEKQKLAVARAIYKDAPIVILDEATSGYDVESDAYLHDVILNELGDKTVLMITHHYDNLEGMDRVYRLQDGVLRESTIS